MGTDSAHTDDPPITEFKKKLAAMLNEIPSRYKEAIKVANTPEQAKAVLERIPDETIAAMEEIQRTIMK